MITLEQRFLFSHFLSGPEFTKERSLDIDDWKSVGRYIVQAFISNNNKRPLTTRYFGRIPLPFFFSFHFFFSFLFFFCVVFENNSTLLQIFTDRKRSLVQGNIFTPVCHSVHRGEYLGRYAPLAGTPPWAGTPRQVHLPGTPPQDQVHPPGPGTPPDHQKHPRGQVHPPDQVHPPTRYTHPPDQVRPRDQVHPPEAGTPAPQAGTPPGRYPPGAVHSGRYGQQAGGTHPTGMHSSFLQISGDLHHFQFHQLPCFKLNSR